ncbi:unnamed protein product [Urochloa humidicola]
MVCCGGNEDLDMLIALVTYSFTAMGSSIGIVVGTYKDTAAGLETWLKVVYLVMAGLTITLFGASIMAARFKKDVSARCGKMGVILVSALLVFTISCLFGRWGRIAAVPSAAVVVCIMAAVWMWAEPRERRAIRGCCCWSRIC